MFQTVGFKLPSFALDGTPGYVREATESSLKKLGVDCIDLYYLHYLKENIAAGMLKLSAEDVQTVRDLTAQAGVELGDWYPAGMIALSFADIPALPWSSCAIYNLWQIELRITSVSWVPQTFQNLLWKWRTVETALNALEALENTVEIKMVVLSNICGRKGKFS
ncbi:hypothetical protein DFH08DRAFT_820927 [Mycena albidolilacea]|uniref:NADP-dependent oxidoreductase domain-containing protein n=1 Tax=Mycena albidolilacea TaxID=1033008 RepID=A0AAD6ZBG3_9AGAR|nr:hypothetical protein DFH08DRAFT_820927 [Mycena albidolilacea]